MCEKSGPTVLLLIRIEMMTQENTINVRVGETSFNSCGQCVCVYEFHTMKLKLSLDAWHFIPY